MIVWRKGSDWWGWQAEDFLSSPSHDDRGLWGSHSPHVLWDPSKRGREASEADKIATGRHAFFFFFLKILFIIHERHRDRGRDTGRGRNRIMPCRGQIKRSTTDDSHALFSI